MTAPSPSARSFVAATDARTNNFDFLRFGLASVVIYTHAYGLLGHFGLSLQEKIAERELGGARFAVEMFFVISGFLICNSFLHSHGLADYLKKRFLRIYPGFLTVLVVCVAVVGPLGGAEMESYFRSSDTYRWFGQLLLGPAARTLPGVFTHQPVALVDGSLWTIRLEVFCYLFLAVVGVAGLLRRRGAVLGLFLLSLAAVGAQIRQWPGPWVLAGGWVGDLWELPGLLSYFLAGMTFYLWRDAIPFRLSAAAGALAALVGAYLLDARYALHLREMVFPIAAAYLLMYVAFHPRLPLHNWARWGDFSYGMYLYGFPIQQLVIARFGARMHPLTLLAAAYPLTLAAAVISWYAVERPCLMLKGSGRGRIETPRPSGPGPLLQGTAPDA